MCLGGVGLNMNSGGHTRTISAMISRDWNTRHPTHPIERVTVTHKQRWNGLHSLCRIGMEYCLLNDNNDDDNNNNNDNNNYIDDDDDDDNDNNDNNNNDNNDDDDDDNHNDNDNNNNIDNNDDALGCFFTNVTFTAVAEISIRGDFFSEAIINFLNLTCFSFISFYSELTSVYISTPYTYQVWI